MLINNWNRVLSALEEGRKSSDVRWYMTRKHSSSSLDSVIIDREKE